MTFNKTSFITLSFSVSESEILEKALAILKDTTQYLSNNVYDYIHVECADDRKLLISIEKEIEFLNKKWN